MLDTSKYTPKEVETLKQNYIGNECYSDEYRETQPAKGIGHFQNALQLLNNEIFDIEPTETQLETLIKLTSKCDTWIRAYGQWYEGDGELAILLNLVFDIMWAHNEHPYYDTNAEIDERFEDEFDEI